MQSNKRYANVLISHCLIVAKSYWILDGDKFQSFKKMYEFHN